MKHRKRLYGFCILLIAAVVATGVQNAGANTAFRCSASASSKTFGDAHCKSSGSAFGHVEIPVNTLTPVTTTNITTGTERSVLKLRSVQSGVTLELQATGVEGTGTIENQTDGTNMWSVYAPVVVLKGVTVTAPPGKGCKVPGGSITTSSLTATTKGLTDQIKISAAGGANWAEFTIEGCSVAALNHPYTYSGSLIAHTTGSTLQFTHTASTEQGTFFTSGQKAGLEGSLTLKDESTGEGIAFT
jgi:hypothetical protein